MLCVKSSPCGRSDCSRNECFPSDMYDGDPNFFEWLIVNRPYTLHNNKIFLKITILREVEFRLKMENYLYTDLNNIIIEYLSPHPSISQISYLKPSFFGDFNYNYTLSDDDLNNSTIIQNINNTQKRIIPRRIKKFCDYINKNEKN